MSASWAAFSITSEASKYPLTTLILGTQQGLIEEVQLCPGLGTPLQRCPEHSPQ